MNSVASPCSSRVLMTVCPSRVSRYSFSWQRSRRYCTVSASHMMLTVLPLSLSHQGIMTPLMTMTVTMTMTMTMLVTMTVTQF